MLIDIKPIGGYLEINGDGYIQNSCHRDNIPGIWMNPIEELVTFYSTYHKENLISVYLRGSVPRGVMVNSVSDIDSFCLTQTDTHIENIKPIEEFQSDLSQRYGFVNGVEIDSYSIENALEMKSIRFLIKTQSLCVFGADVSTDIEPMSISVDSLSTCIYLAEINAKFLVQCEVSDSEGDARSLCVWIFKMALRAAFEIVMMREYKYTRDIYFCWKSYSKHYLEHSDLLEQALCNVVNPIAEISEIKDLWERIFAVLGEHMRKNEHLIGTI